MTTENAYVKLAAVTQQLGEERTKNDSLTNENSVLKEDITVLNKTYMELFNKHRDLLRDFEQYKEVHGASI